MLLKPALAEVVRRIPHCFAAACVDTTTGALLGLWALDALGPESAEMVAAATSDLFLGNRGERIESFFRRANGGSALETERYFQECLMLSANLVHVFVRGRQYQSVTLMTISRSDANLGLVLAMTRELLELVETAVLEMAPAPTCAA